MYIYNKQNDYNNNNNSNNIMILSIEYYYGLLCGLLLLWIISIISIGEYCYYGLSLCGLLLLWITLVDYYISIISMDYYISMDDYISIIMDYYIII